MTEIKVTYIGNRPAYIFKTEWITGSSKNTKYFFELFKSEYSASSTLGTNPLAPDQNFVNWLLSHKIDNFSRLFEVSQINNHSTGAIEVIESSIKTSASAESALEDLTRQVKLVKSNSESIAKSDKKSLTGSKTVAEKIKDSTPNSNTMSGDDIAKTAEVATNKYTTESRAFNPTQGSKKVITLESTSKQEEVYSQYNTANVFNPLINDEKVESVSSIIVEQSEPNISVELAATEVASEDTAKAKAQRTYSPIDFTKKVTLDVLIRTSDLEELAELVKSIKEKGILQNAKVLAQNNRDHDRAKIFEEQLRTLS
jgi:hypothetical protein